MHKHATFGTARMAKDYGGRSAGAGPILNPTAYGQGRGGGELGVSVTFWLISENGKLPEKLGVIFRDVI